MAERKPATKQVTLDETQKAILNALSNMKRAVGCGDIAKAANLPTPKVVGKMRSLATLGLVTSPEKGKYRLTPKGRRALAA